MTDPDSALRELFGLACPNCGHADTLQIGITCTAELTANGSEVFGDHDWDSSSYCCCPDCQHKGIVRDFETTTQGDQHE